MVMKQHIHRRVQIYAVDRRPRSALGHTRHASIDAALKNIKLCGRRLQLSLKAQLDEAQILERLYYKGKNQHRAALFWRRVEDMRRFCRRIDSVEINVVVDTLYRSFFDEKLVIGPKPPKGPWTHFPDTAFVKSVLARLSACSELLKKMYSRLMDAYQSFALAMQSGAFLQLVLTLAAIASRMGTLSLDLRDALEVTTTVAHNILFIINLPDTESFSPVTDGQVPHLSDEAETTNLDTSRHDNPLLSTASVEPPRSVEIDIVVPSEDPQLPPRVVIEYKAHRQVLDGIEPKRKRRKRNEPKMKDEIDAIFGF